MNLNEVYFGKTEAIQQMEDIIRSLRNKYTSTKVAKVTSKKSAQTVKIKGLKKGMAKVTIKVNGVSFKIKVKVV